MDGDRADALSETLSEIEAVLDRALLDDAAKLSVIRSLVRHAIEWDAEVRAGEDW